MSRGTRAAPAPPVGGPAARLTRWAWIMVVLFFVAFAVSMALGYAAMAWLGLEEGEMLSAAGGTGWLVAGGLLVVQVVPAAVGAALATRAVRLGGGGVAASALVVNVLLGVYALVVQLFQLVAG